jgi:hypothetical protein
MQIPNLDRTLDLGPYKAVGEIQLYLVRAWEENPELVRWTPGQKQFLAIENMEGEINNGGYNQYFWNLSGDHVASCLEGLERIGAVKEIALMKRAIGLFPGGRVPEDRGERQDVLDEMGEDGVDAFHELDSEYYSPGGIDIAVALIEMIRKNRHEF